MDMVFTSDEFEYLQSFKVAVYCIVKLFFLYENSCYICENYKDIGISLPIVD